MSPRSGVVKVRETATAPLAGWHRVRVSYYDLRLDDGIIWIPDSMSAELLEDMLLDAAHDKGERE